MAVWLCSGQGAQKPGMGADLLDIPEVAEVFSEISNGLGFEEGAEIDTEFGLHEPLLPCDLATLTREGTPEQINEPVAAQALTMAVSAGIGRALQARGIQPTAIIGFSLGQISALVLANVLSLHDAIALLRMRADAMARACEENPGGMVALMGATLEDAQALCEQCANGKVLVPANINAPGQIVISGTEEALTRAQDAWKEQGKRSVRLATAGGFHSPLMKSAAIAVENFCEKLDFNEPSVPLICNTDAQPFVAAEAAERLGRQVESGVQFEQSVRNLLDAGESEFVEVGFGGVLTNLIKRIDKEATRIPVGNKEQFEDYVKEN